VARIQEECPVVFPVHPRTRQHLERLNGHLPTMANLRLVNPLPYLEFVQLMSNARCVLTDSGGIQEETTILKVPCLTLRENTERPITAELGSSTIVGTNPEKIWAAFEKVMAGEARPAQMPPLWDGSAARRIVEVLKKHL